jgi:hypothetical protein
MPKGAATLIVVALVAISPRASADDCFCLSHPNGAYLRGCEAFKAATDFYSTAACTDPEVFRMEADRGRRRRLRPMPTCSPKHGG